MIPEAFAPRRLARSIAQIVAVFAEAVADERTDEKVAIGGTANLMRFGDDFDTLDQAAARGARGARRPAQAARRGRPARARSPCGSATRSPHEQLAATSVVATGYGPGDRVLATLGVVGPTRMDYPGSMAAVNAVARYVSQILADA